jgi:hypothetical protein
MAAVGALLVSSGIALMAVPTAATAAQLKQQHVPVGVCHATSSDTNPYVFIVVDNDSVKLAGHLMHKTNPNKVWKSTVTWHGTTYGADDAKRDYIGSYTDEDGVLHQEDGTVTEEWCEAGTTTEAAVADVDFVEPSCDNGNVGTFLATGDHVTFEVVTGTPGEEPDTYVAGSHVVVAASPDDGFAFAEGQTGIFEWTFAPAEEGCTVEPPVEPPVVEPPVVEPPVVEPPVVEPSTQIVTPTVVEAGLVGERASGASGGQGLALVASGLALMAAAAVIAIRKADEVR